MKVLVTGGAGFIGSHVVEAYLGAGHDVVIVDNLSTGRRENLNPKAVFYEIDIRDPGLIEVFKKEEPDIVNHHAAQMSVRVSVDQPIMDADVNVLGTINLLECARGMKVSRIVYISTGGAVYGEPVYLPCDEEHPIRPICPYGVSKHTVEHYLFLYREIYDLDYVVLRYPNVYGPRQDPGGEAGVVAIFTGQMLEGSPVTINGDGTQERDFVYVGDCARANLIVSSKDVPSGIYNLGSGKGTSVNQIFDALQQVTGYQPPASFGPPKLGETYRIYLDPALAFETFGWKAEVLLDQGLTRTVDYFRHSTAQAGNA
ncbi:MAG: NAD-dependent epimerase/dehydratase family protein [Anaerolineales bacterium]